MHKIFPTCQLVSKVLNVIFVVRLQGSPNNKFGGPGQGLAGESGNTKNSVALGKVLIISENGSTSNPNNALDGGYFEFTFLEPHVLHQVGLLDNKPGGTLFETWNGTDFYESRKLGVGGANAAETLRFFDEGLGSFTKLRITLFGPGAVSFLEIEKASEISFPCALPTDANKYSLITSRNANNGAHSMYKGMAVGGLLVDETPNESGTVDRTMSFIQAMTSQSRFNFNGGVTFNQTVPLSMYEHFAFLARNAVNSSNTDGFKVVVLTKGGTYNLYHFVPGGQGEDNGKTLVIFNTQESITITATSDGRQFGPSIIAPFANVSVSSNAGYVDGLIMAKNFLTSSACGSLQLHADTYTGQIQCRAGATVTAPVKAPTKIPTKAPTKRPTKAPTKVPTKAPTKRPTKVLWLVPL